MNGNYNLFVKQSLLKCLNCSRAIFLKIIVVISNNYLKIFIELIKKKKNNFDYSKYIKPFMKIRVYEVELYFYDFII